MLPDDIAEQVLRGMLGADRLGFLTRRWADAFTGAARTRVSLGRLSAQHPGSGCTASARTRTSCARARTEADVDERMAALRERDRRGPQGRSSGSTAPSCRRTSCAGCSPTGSCWTTSPEWRERVVHVAFAYPSRQDLAVYRDYTAEVQRLAEEINSEYGTPGWTPVVLHVKDDFARSLAAYRLADVALVNPIRDGMNLVAKEVPVVSDEGCALVLSREAGAYEELGEDAITVNPYDVIGHGRGRCTRR